MCLSNKIDTRPDSDIGYKVMKKKDDYYGAHFGGPYKLNEEYEREPDALVMVHECRYYQSGFHVYRHLEDARRFYELHTHNDDDYVLVKVRGRNLLASGLNYSGYKDCVRQFSECDVYEFMTILEEVCA